MLHRTSSLVAALAVVASCAHDRAPASPASSARTAAPSAAPARAHEPPAEAPVTYWKTIAPLLEAHCTSCHAPGGIGPVPLVSFEEAHRHASAIARVTATREMPPWLPATGTCRALQHPRVLDDAAIRAFAAWARDGAPEGARADYRPPPPRSADELNELPEQADITVEPEKAYAPKQGREDDYHCFVLDPKLRAASDVVGVRVLPGERAVVHHVILFEVKASAVPRLARLDAAERGPGYTCFGGIGIAPRFRAAPLENPPVAFDVQMVLGWAPGGRASWFPRDTGIRLSPGSRLVLQVHYSNRNYEPGMTDRTRVQLFTAKAPVAKQAFWVPLADQGFHVPPGVGPDDPRAVAQHTYAIPFPLEVYGVAPHMHLRGKEIRVDVASPPPAECLLDVPRWDFHMQEAYWFAQPRPAQSATLTCRYDNRAESQPDEDGKRPEPHELHWGEGTDDEMCLAFLYATL